ncbi:MAG TPA: Gfo/Idh/MocA family oxidoreductase [Euzebya sp.]|nr:Gfo/Idh/MocA family oxidoreductase [Euzebya sp.]
MRIGILGGGFMGRVHAQGWAAIGAELTAVAGPPHDPPTDLAQQFGATACATFPELLERVDVVDVCAPTHLHHDLVLTAARAGRHVICEKPLARTPQQGAAMLAACEEAGVQLLVAHVVRFFPEYAAAKAAVGRGAIGTPAVLRLSRATFQPRKQADNWFTDEARSGGLVLDLMVHDFDIARWIAGDVTTVFAKGLAARNLVAGVDHCLALLTHSGGAITHVEGSWAYPAPAFRTRFEIAGSSGVLDFDSDRDAPVRTLRAPRDDAGEIPLPGSPLAEAPHTTQLRHLLAVLRGDVAPIVTAADGLAAVQIAAAVATSIRSGAPVDVARDEVWA